MEAAGPRGRVYQPHATWPGGPDRRVRTTRRRLRQRRTVAGGGAPAVLQRPRRLDLRRQQRDSAQHPRQGGVGAVGRNGLHTHRRTGTAARRSDAGSSRRATTSRRAGPPPRPARAGSPTSGAPSPTNSASSARRCPKTVGGIGGGPVEIMVIAEALGHALVVEPYVDTAVVAAGLLRRAGGDACADRAGDASSRARAIVALAATEPTSGDHWQDVSTTAAPRRDRVGAHRHQDHRRRAHRWPRHLLVTARTSGDRDEHGGISLFVVDSTRRSARSRDCTATAPSTTAARPT